MRNQRKERISEEVKKELSRILREEVKDPRIGELSSILRADVTGDLRYAKIFVSILGDEAEKKSTMEGLDKASGFIRKELGRSLNLRHTPELRFILDSSIEYSVDINKKISELNLDPEDDN